MDSSLKKTQGRKKTRNAQARIRQRTLMSAMFILLHGKGLVINVLSLNAEDISTKILGARFLVHVGPISNTAKD